MAKTIPDQAEREPKLRRLTGYFEKYLAPKFAFEEIQELCPAEVEEFEKLRFTVLDSMRKADEIAIRIRAKVKDHLQAVSNSTRHSD